MRIVRGRGRPPQARRQAAPAPSHVQPACATDAGTPKKPSLVFSRSVGSVDRSRAQRRAVLAAADARSAQRQDEVRM